MPLLAAAVAVAACDEMRDCVVSEIPDRGACVTSVAVTQPTTRAFVRSYTATPGLTYDPPCGVAHVHFLSPNASDPESATHPYWARVWDSDVDSVDSRCVVSRPPPIDGLTAVFEVSGIPDGEIRFERAGAANDTVWFDRTDAVGVWISTSPEHADVRVEMDQRYTFPGCCDFPTSFNDTAGRLWRQSALESTCGTTDSAEYVYEGLEYTTASVYNETHERWRFETQFPSVGLCSPGSLAEPFVVDVFVPRTDRELGTVDALVGPPAVPYSSVAVYGVVLGTVLGTMATVLGLKTCLYYYTMTKKRVKSKS